jgi:hypothetical protein
LPSSIIQTTQATLITSAMIRSQVSLSGSKTRDE